MPNSLASKPSYSYKKASFIKRLAAFYLASVFVIFVSYFFSFVISESGLFNIELYSKPFWTLFITLIFLGFLTDEFFKCLLKFNLAKLLLGLRVVDEREFQSIGFYRAIFRTIFAFLSFVFLGLGFVSILFNREKLSMHDMLVHSSVVDLSENIFARIVSALAAFLIAIPGFLISFSFIVILLGSPLFVWSSVKDYQYRQTIEISEWFDKPKAQYSVNLSDYEDKKAVTFLLVDTGDYYENFVLTPNEQFSTVNINEFPILKNIDKLKFDLRKFLDTRDFLNSFYLKFSKLVFKSTANYDLSIKNPRLYLAYKSKIANDLLSTFNYNIVEQKNLLNLKISNNITSVLKNKKLSYLLKTEYVNAIYYIESQWRKFLFDLVVDEKSKLINNKKELANNVRIIIDNENGYIKQFDIINPGKNTLFNRICNRFLNKLQFKVFDPADLSPDDIKDNSFDVTLIYQSLI